MTDELRAALAEDSIALERALGSAFDDEARRAITDVLAGTRERPHGDCALDIIVEDRPVRERVEIQLQAKAAGYQRPWPRDGRDAK